MILKHAIRYLELTGSDFITDLKDSNGGTVKVTSVIRDDHGKVETNGQLAPGVHLVTFSADGYQDVTAGVSVTDHS